MNCGLPAKVFTEWKINYLKKADKSPKGSVDEKIVDLVDYINKLGSYYTTSSCSGRIVVFTNRTDLGVKGKGCDWIYTSHNEADYKAILSCLENHTGYTIFKFEPFILHVRCATTKDAQALYVLSTDAGFRNSGLTLSKTGKITLAVRSPLSLEVPFSENGKILVSNEYVEYVVKKANEKMILNWTRINCFYLLLKQKFPLELQDSTVEENQGMSSKNK